MVSDFLLVLLRVTVQRLRAITLNLPEEARTGKCALVNDAKIDSHGVLIGQGNINDGQRVKHAETEDVDSRLRDRSDADR